MLLENISDFTSYMHYENTINAINKLSKINSENNFDDKTLLLFKFGMHKYINFLSKGELYFSCAGNYIFIAHKYGNMEQGDENEGVFARQKNNSPLITKCKKIYGNNLEIISDNVNYAKLRLRTSLCMPLYCMYSISENDVKQKIIERGEKIIEDKIYNIRHDFNEKMFTAFSDSANNVLSKKEDRSAIIMFRGLPFENELKKSLLRENIHYRYEKMNYEIKSQKEYFIQPINGNELFFKEPQYKYQQEYRICLTNCTLPSIFDGKRIRVAPFIISNEVRKMKGAKIFENPFYMTANTSFIKKK